MDHNLCNRGAKVGKIGQRERAEGQKGGRAEAQVKAEVKAEVRTDELKIEDRELRINKLRIVQLRITTFNKGNKTIEKGKR